ncbi:MAG: flagellar basal body protein [bacterium]|nr:flagellar basal body protein [Burkholderiaceae bacterium]MDO8729109.1 flagellar basal body protein [bacterium]
MNPIEKSSALASTAINSVSNDKLRSVTPAGKAFAEALAKVNGQSSTSTNTPPLKLKDNFNEHPLLIASQSHINPPVAKNEEEDSVHERAVALRAFRQEVLASNIANADTPGYKAVDFDINEAMRTGKYPRSIELKYVVSAQGNIDGNTVDMDIERVKFMENQIMYNFAVDRVRGHYKDMEDLLKNTPY